VTALASLVFCLVLFPSFPLPIKLLNPQVFSGEGGRETGVKLSPGRKEGWGEGVFKI